MIILVSSFKFASGRPIGPNDLFLASLPKEDVYIKEFVQGNFGESVFKQVSPFLIVITSMLDTTREDFDRLLQHPTYVEYNTRCKSYYEAKSIIRETKTYDLLAKT